MSRRISASLTVALLAAVVAYYQATHGALYDWEHYRLGGLSLLEGRSPYPAFVYPLPAALWSALFAWMPREIGGALFVGSAFGLLTFGLTRENFDQFPILCSGPALWCLISGQWAPLIVAAALTPTFALAAVGKPTLALAAFAYRPSWRFVWIGGAMVGASLLIRPTWPVEWITATRSGTDAKLWSIPVLQPFGVLLLLALAKWRTPEGRLLVAMSVVPQSLLIYDQFPLLLVAKGRAEVLAATLWSLVMPLLVGYLTIPADLSAADGTAQTFPFWARVITWTLYLPALGIVLRRKG